MGLMQTAAEIWRKYVTDGIPASGPNQPDKTAIVAWGTWLETMIGSGVPGLAYATLSALSADLAHAANSTAIVYADGSDANNGFYVKVGGSGSGSWSRIGDLPYAVVPLTVTGGTGNAILATAPETPLQPGRKLFVMTPSANNSGATTITYNGGSALSVKSAFGTALIGGELLVGSAVIMLGASDHFTLLLSTNVDASGILASAQAAQAAAAASAASAFAAAAGANSISLSRSALAAATVDASIKAVVCLGYAAAGDCAAFTVKRVSSQPLYGGVRSTDRYLPNGSTDSTNGGWWVYVPGPSGIDACAFGFKVDWDNTNTQLASGGGDTGATDNTTALQNALNFAAVQFNPGYDSGGGHGGVVLLPRGTGMIGSTIVVPTGVILKGTGVLSSILKMKSTFDNNSHFVILGTQGVDTFICQAQSRGSAGAFTLNGSGVVNGVAQLLFKQIVDVVSSGNDSAINFTVTGTDGDDQPLTQTKSGANVGTVSFDGLYKTVTSVTCSGATAGNVKVGTKIAASFSSRLEDLNLWSNHTQAASGKAMVYSSSTQHTGGLSRCQIEAGNRHAVRLEEGVGGASVFIMEDIYVGNYGNMPGVASNNACIYLNYGGLLTTLRRIVVSGTPLGGSAATGILIDGGQCHLSDIHVEVYGTGIWDNIRNVNAGLVTITNYIASGAMDAAIKIDGSATADPHLLVQSIMPNGATHTLVDVRLGGTTTDGNILAWTQR